MSSILILGREIPLYGIFFYLGIFFAALAAIFFAHKRGFSKIEIVYSGIYTMIGATIGAKLLFIIVSLKDIIEYDIPIAAVIKGGFVFYGGFLGGFLGLFIYTKQFKLQIWDYLDIYAVVLPLGHAFGRVGCFFAGCCYGVQVPGGYTYTETLGTTPLGVPLLPIQLIESACLLIVFVVQTLVFFLKPCAKKLSTEIYLIAYPILRFILEFFRGDKERGKFIFSTSQWISCAILVLSVIFIMRDIYKRKKATLDTL